MRQYVYESDMAIQVEGVTYNYKLLGICDSVAIEKSKRKN